MVLLDDKKAQSVKTCLDHEMKHVYFGAFFPQSDELSFLDRAKNEIIAYLEEYRSDCRNEKELADEVFQMFNTYLPEILGDKKFSDLNEERNFMSKFYEIGRAHV